MGFVSHAQVERVLDLSASSTTCGPANRTISWATSRSHRPRSPGHPQRHPAGRWTPLDAGARTRRIRPLPRSRPARRRPGPRSSARRTRPGCPPLVKVAGSSITLSAA